MDDSGYSPEIAKRLPTSVTVRDISRLHVDVSEARQRLKRPQRVGIGAKREFVRQSVMSAFVLRRYRLLNRCVTSVPLQR
jgi:hypothetical protein